MSNSNSNNISLYDTAASSIVSTSDASTYSFINSDDSMFESTISFAFSDILNEDD